MKFNNLHLHKPLEKGLWRNTYEGIYTPGDQPAVIEVIDSSRGVPQEEIEHFQNCAQKLALLNHPNILKMLTYGEKDGLYYLAIEKDNNINLVDHIARGEYIHPLEATHLIQDMASGLKAIHDIGHVHGDLHPANVIISKTGDVKLRNSFQFRQNKDYLLNMVSQKPQYVSPEHLRMRNLKFSSDQYTLGIMYYHLLTGRTPYESKDIREIWKMHLEGDVPALPPELRAVKGLEKFIRTLLAKRPKHRYLDDATLISALTNIEGIFSKQITRQTPKTATASSKKPDLEVSSENVPEASKPTNPPLKPANILKPEIINKDDIEGSMNGKIGAQPEYPVAQGKLNSKSSEMKSMWIMSAVALAISSLIIVVLINQHGGAQKLEDHQNLNSSPQLEAHQKSSPADVHGVTQPNSDFLMSSSIEPPEEDMRTEVEIKRDEKIALIKSYLSQPKEYSIPRVEALLEDPDPRIRFIANQVYRDIKGGVLISEEDAAKIIPETYDLSNSNQWIMVLNKISKNTDEQSEKIIKDGVEHEDPKVRHLAMKLLYARKSTAISEILFRQLKLYPGDRSLDQYADRLNDQHLALLKDFTKNGDARDGVLLLPYWTSLDGYSANFLAEILVTRSELSMPVALKLANLGATGREVLLNTLLAKTSDSICSIIISALREMELDKASLLKLESIYGKLSLENNQYLSGLLATRGKPIAIETQPSLELKTMVALEDLPKKPEKMDLDNLYSQLNLGNQDLDQKIIKVFSTSGNIGIAYLEKVIRGKYSLELKRNSVESMLRYATPETIAIFLEVACDSQTRSELVKDLKSAIAKCGSSIIPVLINNKRLTAPQKIEYIIPIATANNAIAIVEIIHNSSDFESRGALQALLDAYPSAQICYDVLLQKINNDSHLQYILKGLSRCGGKGGIEGSILLLKGKSPAIAEEAYQSLKQRLSGEMEEWYKALANAEDTKIKSKIISNLTADNPYLPQILEEYVGHPEEECRKAVLKKVQQFKILPTIAVLSRIIMEKNESLKRDWVNTLLAFEPPNPIVLLWGQENLPIATKKKLSQKMTELSINKKQLAILTQAINLPYPMELKVLAMRYLIAQDHDITEELFRQLQENDPHSIKLFQEGMLRLGSKSIVPLLRKLNGANSNFLRNQIENVLSQQKVKYLLDPQSGLYKIQ